MNNHSKYVNSLEQFSCGKYFLSAGEKMSNEYLNQENEVQKVIMQCVSDVIGPTLVSYCLWILKEANESDTHTLFFLARDGKILMDICNILIRKYHLNIQCKYLYVSRYSLRKALFCISPDETIHYLCKNSLHATPASVLQRSGLSKQEQEKILHALGYVTEAQQNTILTSHTLHNLNHLLQQSQIFHSLMQQMSSNYNNIIFQYFQEQGLTDGSRIAIVDSGWTGSMQRCIRQILEHNGVKVRLEGYYFGIQAKPREEDGIYHWFYFGPENIYEYVHFNNNLFECWCMANHGMTIDYQLNSENSVMPILKVQMSQWYSEFQADAIKKYTTYFISKPLDFHIIKFDQLKDMVRPLVVRFMTHPDKKESTVYGSIPFCDDTTEAYWRSLATPLLISDLLKNLTIIRILCKMLGSIKQITVRESGWREGTIANLPIPLYIFMLIYSQLV